MEIKIRLVEGKDFFTLPENARTQEYKKEFVTKMEIKIRNRLLISYYDDIIHFIKWNDTVNFIKYKNLNPLLYRNLNVLPELLIDVINNITNNI